MQAPIGQLHRAALPRRHVRRPCGARLSLVVGFLALVAGCSNDMYDQPKYRTFAASDFFEDGLSARPLVPGTVPRRADDQAALSAFARTGRDGNAFVDALPFPADQGALERGRQRYQIFCAPCHGATGIGDGTIVRRGFPRPPSLIEGEVAKAPLGEYFDVITHGHGVMYAYDSRIPVRDRWSIAAYLRVLQLSQRAEVDRLSDEDRAQLAEGQEAPR